MKEKIVNFGKGGCCLGVMTEPSQPAQNGGLPAVLLWNAGLLHRVGPYRLYVDLARKLASIGFPVLRFDRSGKGDSEARSDSTSERERSTGDIIDAMDVLSKSKGVERFVLMGLCSGADDAFPVGVQDPRVTGLIVLDGYGYRTLGYYLHHYAPRVFRWGVWKMWVERNFRMVSSSMKDRGGPEGLGGDIFVREFPPKKEVQRDLLALVDRRVHVLFVYSGGVREEYYNYQGQFKDMFKGANFDGRVEVKYFQEAAHTYTRLDHRKRLMTCVLEWMQRHYRDTQTIVLPAS